VNLVFKDLSSARHENVNPADLSPRTIILNTGCTLASSKKLLKITIPGSSFSEILI